MVAKLFKKKNYPNNSRYINSFFMEWKRLTKYYIAKERHSFLLNREMNAALYAI